MPAEENDLDELEDGEKNGRGKLFLIIGIAALLLISAAGAFFLLSGNDEDVADSETEVAAEENENIAYETAYFDISKDIVSNVQGKAKYLRAHIQLVTDRADMLYEIETHAPLYRHVILMTLVDKKGESIQTPKGKESLRQELLKTVSAALDNKIETKGLITDLIFTAYYVK